MLVGCSAPPAEVELYEQPVLEYQAAPNLSLAPIPETERDGEPAPRLPYIQISANTFIPLFEYGEGGGTPGQIQFIGQPTIFMSEKEAFAILSAVFADAGLTLSMEDQPLDDKTLPVTNNQFRSHAGWAPSETTQGELYVWSLNADGWLPVVFVSQSDVISWYGERGRVSSVSWYDTLAAARVLAENNPRLVVFYDPIVGRFTGNWVRPEMQPGESDVAFRARESQKWMQHVRAEAERLRSEVPQEQQPGESDEEYRWRMIDENQKNILAESEKFLRQQAAAFVEWLRAEGHH